MRICSDTVLRLVFLFLILLNMTLVLVFPAVSAELDIDTFIREASISYSREFSIPAHIDRWNAMLDNPVLMGKIWDVCGCKPEYKISSRGEIYHVVDPTGIEGDIKLIHSAGGIRRYYGAGRLRNWFIPVSLKGGAMFIVESASQTDSVAVKLSIYGEKGDDVVTRFILRAISPLLRYHIDKRVRENIQDINRISTILQDDPDSIGMKLSGWYLDAFEKMIGAGSNPETGN